MPIPNIIHQTWKSEDVPVRFAAFQAAWKHLNPGWEYRFWTDQSTRMFVAQHYPWFLPTYDAYDVPIKRADAARYLYLYHFGGVYADLDLEPLRPLDTLLGQSEQPELLMASEPEEHCALYETDTILSNAFLASTADHAAWREILELLVQRSTWPDPLSATGPFLLTDLYQNSPKFRCALRVLDPVTINPFSKFETWAAAEIGASTRLRERAPKQTLAIHHWVGSWWRERTEIESFVDSTDCVVPRSVDS